MGDSFRAEVVRELPLAGERLGLHCPTIWRAADSDAVGLLTAPATVSVLEATPDLAPIARANLPLGEISGGAVNRSGRVLFATPKGIELLEQGRLVAAQRPLREVRAVAIDEEWVWACTLSLEGLAEIHRFDLGMSSCETLPLDPFDDDAGFVLQVSGEHVVVEVGLGQDDAAMFLVRRDLTTVEAHGAPPFCLVPGGLAAEKYLALSSGRLEWRRRGDGPPLARTKLEEGQPHAWAAVVLADHVVLVIGGYASQPLHLLAFFDRETLAPLGTTAPVTDGEWSIDAVEALGSNHILVVESRHKPAQRFRRARVLALARP